MAQRIESLDLATLGLSSGEGTSLELVVPVAAPAYGGQTYSTGEQADARLDVSRTTGEGYALRLRLALTLDGPCMRCLEPAYEPLAVDARELEQPSSGDELRSPYVSEDQRLDLAAWARDAIALAQPAQVLCRADCLGLCAICGANLNEDPEHAHERPADPRWAKLSELELD